MDKDTNSHAQPFTADVTWGIETETAFQPLCNDDLKFSSYYTRKVDRTVDIKGRLPNAIYTLPAHLIQAIIGRAGLTDKTREVMFAECQKFFLANSQYERSKFTYVDGVPGKCTTITLDCGRLFAEGNNYHGQCGLASTKRTITGPRLIRIPPVLSLWHSRMTWWAQTTLGFYVWGENYQSWLRQLGMGDGFVSKPLMLSICQEGDEVIDLHMSYHALFIKKKYHPCWLCYGTNYLGQFGLGHAEWVTKLTPIPGSERINRWITGCGRSFAITNNSILACGSIYGGQCGVGRVSNAKKGIIPLTPVILPPEFLAKVDRVECGSYISYFLAGTRCFVCGWNIRGQLREWTASRFIRTPIELPIAVDDIAFAPMFIPNAVTAIRCGNTLLYWNIVIRRRRRGEDDSATTPPTRIEIPADAVKVIIDADRGVFILKADGSWVGRGSYEGWIFEPDDKSTGEYDHHQPIVEWTGLTEKFADRLTHTAPGREVMRLPKIS